MMMRFQRIRKPRPMFPRFGTRFPCFRSLRQTKPRSSHPCPGIPPEHFPRWRNSSVLRRSQHLPRNNPCNPSPAQRGSTAGCGTCFKPRRISPKTRKFFRNLLFWKKKRRPRTLPFQRSKRRPRTLSLQKMKRHLKYPLRLIRCPISPRHPPGKSALWRKKPTTEWTSRWSAFSATRRKLPHLRSMKPFPWI